MTRSRGVFQGEWQGTKNTCISKVVDMLLMSALASLEIGYCFTLIDKAELES